jgi:hypothetical protein
VPEDADDLDVKRVAFEALRAGKLTDSGRAYAYSFEDERGRLSEGREN